MSFTHLHVHSEYSLLDGACRIEPMLDKIKSMGQTSVAITDHGVMYGVIDFYKAALKRDIKPVIGCEVYVANRSRFSKEHLMDWSYHLVLLCENNTGYKNLIKLVSAGFTEGFYKKPRVDKELLKKTLDFAKKTGNENILFEHIFAFFEIYFVFYEKLLRSFTESRITISPPMTFRPIR